MMQELNYICCGDYYIPDIRLSGEIGLRELVYEEVAV